MIVREALFSVMMFSVAGILLVGAMRGFRTIVIPGVTSGSIWTKVGMVVRNERPITFWLVVSFWLFLALTAILITLAAVYQAYSTTGLLGVI